MLAGIAAADRGTILVDHHPMHKTRTRKLAREKLGYCPQENPLLPLLSVDEHLRLYGKLRGLRGAPLEEAVKSYATALQLLPYRKVLAQGLSGGTKRKLMIATALIGEPEV